MEMAFKPEQKADYIINGSTFDYTTEEYALIGDFLPIRINFSFRFKFNGHFREPSSVSTKYSDFQGIDTICNENIGRNVRLCGGR